MRTILDYIKGVIEFYMIPYLNILIIIVKYEIINFIFEVIELQKW